MRRIYSRRKFTSNFCNFPPKHRDFEIGDFTTTAKVAFFIICAVGFAAFICFFLSATKEKSRGSETVRSKVYYRRVVEFVGYEDIVYYPNGAIDESEPSERVDHRTGRKLLTKGRLSSGLEVEDSGTLYRARRDYFSETERYSEYRRHRSANSDVGIKTITVVHNNDIKTTEIKGHETPHDSDEKPVRKHGDEHRERTEENMSEMDVIYFKAVEACEERNATNTTSHDNSTSSHNNDHGENCAQELASGLPALWVALYVLLILFLFIGLAIICDDFFIASLEAISQRLNLSEDVAGATFMAAGSSAPELFISIAGAGAGSDVGVGTIVGSAVFNLLIIIALTAALAGKVLCLDWRPFVRDSVFYSMSIVAFILFSMDTLFQFWESLMLLGLYALYIVVMKFNPQLMDFMAKWKCCSCFESQVSPQDTPEDSKDTTPKSTSPPGGSNTPAASKPVSRTAVSPEPAPATTANNSAQKVPPPSSPSGSASPAPAVTVSSPTPNSSPTTTPQPSTPELKPKASARSPVRRTVTNGNLSTCTCGSTGMLPQRQMCTCCVIHISSQPCMSCSTFGSPIASMPRMRCVSCSSINEDVMVVNDQGPPGDNQSGKIGTEVTFVEEKNTYLPNFVGNGVGPQEARSASLVTLNSTRTTSGASSNSNNSNSSGNDSKCNGTNGNIKVISGRFEETPSADAGGPAPEEEKTAAEEAPQIVILPCLPSISNSPPEKPGSSECVAGSKYVLMYGVYLLSFPWVCAFTWTVPKCDTPQRRKWYLVSFFLCIVWIAFVSWIMIELVEKIGCLLNIDSYTMGLVIVAVGTSVPDAISSVLVAKDGYADMAVSNALGSNVFDINLGLGLPFFLGSIITSKPISLMSPLQTCLFETLPLSIRIVPHVKFGLILLLVLLVAVAVFIFVRFRLNRQVTVLFITMYVAFMIYAFAQEKICHSFFC